MINTKNTTNTKNINNTNNINISLNTENARELMIQQQIRPWLVLNETTLNLLKNTPRENFVPKNLKNMAFIDTEIPLTTINEKQITMFSPKLEGRIIQEIMLLDERYEHELDEKNNLKNLKFLQIGIGSGYLTAVFAKICQHITAYEVDSVLALDAKKKLQMFENVSVIQENAKDLSTLDFDIVIYDGAVAEITKKMQGKIATIAIEGMRTQEMKLVIIHQNAKKIVVEAHAQYLLGFEPIKYFTL